MENVENEENDDMPLQDEDQNVAPLPHVGGGQQRSSTFTAGNPPFGLGNQSEIFCDKMVPMGVKVSTSH